MDYLTWIIVGSGARRTEVAHAEKGDVRVARNGGGQEVATLTIQAKEKYGWATKSKQDRKVRLPLEFAKRLLAAALGLAILWLW